MNERLKSDFVFHIFNLLEFFDALFLCKSRIVKLNNLLSFVQIIAYHRPLDTFLTLSKSNKTSLKSFHFHYVREFYLK